jgi:hypothetical protein
VVDLQSQIKTEGLVATHEVTFDMMQQMPDTLCGISDGK